MNVLQMSILTAILILTIIIVRAFAIHKLPKKTFVALWGMALFRLLTPFSIPIPIGIQMVSDKLMAYFEKIPNTQVLVFSVPGASLAPGTGTDAIGPIMTPVASDKFKQLYHVSVTLWIVGMVICTMFFLVTHLRYRREYKTTLPFENGYIDEWLKRQKLRRSIQVRHSDRINAPMTYGIWKPVILIPKTIDWQDENRVQYILTHELTHIKRFDVLFKWMLAIALCIHWFNPLVWVMYVLANRDIELSCDETVVLAFGLTAKSDYALTLIGLEEMKSGISPLCSNFARNAIKERIKAIMRMKGMTFGKTTLAVILVAILAVGVLAISTSYVQANAQGSGSLVADPEADMMGEYHVFEENPRQSYDETERRLLATEEVNKAVNARFFSIYEEYGLTYCKETDSLYYNGELVRYYEDGRATDGTFIGRFLTKANGNIDVHTSRDATGKLVAIVPYNQTDFDARTLKAQIINELKSMKDK